MPKQYNFKTTRATEWMEEVLDNLPPSERSRFIRTAIMKHLGREDDILRWVPKEHKERQKDTKLDVKPVVGNLEFIAKIPKKPRIDEPTIEAKIEAKDVDLDSKLNNLFD